MEGGMNNDNEKSLPTFLPSTTILEIHILADYSSL